MSWLYTDSAESNSWIEWSPTGWRTWFFCVYFLLMLNLTYDNFYSSRIFHFIWLHAVHLGHSLILMLCSLFMDDLQSSLYRITSITWIALAPICFPNLSIIYIQKGNSFHMLILVFHSMIFTIFIDFFSDVIRIFQYIIMAWLLWTRKDSH